MKIKIYILVKDNGGWKHRKLEFSSYNLFYLITRKYHRSVTSVGLCEINWAVISGFPSRKTVIIESDSVICRHYEIQCCHLWNLGNRHLQKDDTLHRCNGIMLFNNTSSIYPLITAITANTPSQVGMIRPDDKWFDLCPHRTSAAA